MRFCEAQGCKQPVFSTDKITRKGYCIFHATRLRTDLDRRTIIQKAIAKQNSISTKVRSLNNLEVNRDMVDKKKIFVVDEKLEQWFKDRRNEMVGYCQCGCNQPSSKNDDKFFRCSAAHLLPKKNFKSIMYHPLNFIELNFWNGCHTNFDNLGYQRCKSINQNLWKVVVERFKILYPLISPDEYKFIPDVLLETLKYANQL